MLLAPHRWNSCARSLIPCCNFPLPFIFHSIQFNQVQYANFAKITPDTSSDVIIKLVRAKIFAVIRKKIFNSQMNNHKIQCPCGKDIGINKGFCYEMIAKAFTYKGMKRN